MRRPRIEATSVLVAWQRPVLLLLVASTVAACQGQPAATDAPSAAPQVEPTATATGTGTATPQTTSSAAPTSLRVFPLTITDDEGTEVILAAEPERVVSLTPATTELLFALDAGDKLVGRTDFDDYPPEVADVPAVATFTGVLIEQVVELEPDLVIAGGNNFTPPADVDRLRELGMSVIVVYAPDVDGVLADIQLVADAIGASDVAPSVIAEIERRIDEVGAAVEDLERPRVFYELGNEPEIYGPAPDSFVADMIELAGGQPVTTTDPQVFSISLERLVSEDPEVIVLGDAAYGVCPDTVAARPGWAGVTAVREGNIRPVDDIVVTRPGPRLGEGLAALALAIHPDADIAPPEATADHCSQALLSR